MTHEEAKYWFNHNGASIDQEIETRKLINEALEKQIPKKPLVSSAWDSPEDMGTIYICPSCRKVVFEGYGCHNNECNQRLDWSDVE